MPASSGRRCMIRLHRHDRVRRPSTSWRNHGSRNRSIDRPAKPSIAGNSVTEAITTTVTASEVARATPHR